jgi:tRNA (mo5U34)-methyltransferase
MSNPVLSFTAQHELSREQFLARALELDPIIERFFWYHTIDLGDGLITPGCYDYRETIQDFNFPSDLRGKKVLDVGSATGFFAFEFERRGADVTSVELPSLRQLDVFPGQTVEQSIRKIQRMMYPRKPGGLEQYKQEFTPEQLYTYLLEGPFRFCAERLGSKVRRAYSTIYDLSLSKLDMPDGFDLVFVGDVLVHTLDPFRALAALVPLCKDTLVLAQVMPELPGNKAAMVYIGGADPEEDELSWWYPTQECFVQLLQKFGFRRVREVGHHRGIVMPGEHPFDRVVLHASR